MVKVFQVDAFSSEAFKGNPAAVVLLDAPASALWMGKVASEMNLSETAFLFSTLDNPSFDLRWFTRAGKEVDLCGHATLAAAHVLFTECLVEAGTLIEFNTLSGVLKAKEAESWIELDFPLELAAEAKAPVGLIEALDVTPLYVGKNRFDYLIEVDSEKIVKELKPDLNALKKIDARGVVVTSASTKYDFVSRFFAPSVGIDEDPVTGSAHAMLGPYWGTKLGKDNLRAHQSSSRGGVVKVTLKGERVALKGQAVTVLKGELKV